MAIKDDSINEGKEARGEKKKETWKEQLLKNVFLAQLALRLR